MGVARTQNPFSFKSVRLPFYYLLAEDKQLDCESHPNYQVESARQKKNKKKSTFNYNNDNEL
jgi:hypothetical protein